MSVSGPRQIPGTPRVISPSPNPSETESRTDGYFLKSRSTGDSKREKRRGGPDPDVRARSRSRSVDGELRRRRASGLTPVDEHADDGGVLLHGETALNDTARGLEEAQSANGAHNGHLSPASAAKGRNFWRELSRSPSPSGLIPIHREWRAFVHRHEIPRKVLHVSIGFLTLGLYAYGYQTTSIHPILFALLVPIALVDLIRHNYAPFNAFYIRVLGALMRESEAHDKYNGVIWYLLGAWAVTRFCPKDIGVVSICLLSWCDTAASTFGRLWGRYTPRIRHGKSLAGSLAAFSFGVVTAAMFWGWLAPHYATLGFADNTGSNAFVYQGRLSLPAAAKDLLGLSSKDGTVSGGFALGLLSLWAGFVASASEAVDLFGWDDNVTLPVFCGLGLWSFLRAFGA